MHLRVAARTLFVAWIAIGTWNSYPAAAASELNISVVGNHRIEAATIRSYFHARPDGRLDEGDLDAALKALYATGQFQDVKIHTRDGEIIVNVIENPLVRRLSFEGNRKVKEEQLTKELQSKERGPLSRSLVQSDVERIVELYRRTGRFDVQVEPKVIDTRDQRADLVFEIKEGKKTGVRQVLFVGNQAYRSTELKGAIKTGETNLLSFFLDNDIYDADRIEQDRELLRRFYLKRGYVDIRVVSAAAQYEPDRKGIIVTFKLDEGARYRIGTVDIKSDIENVDAATLRPRLRTQAGAFYDAEALEKTVDDLTVEVSRRGEPFASVRPRGDRVPDRHVINLIYTIERGSRVYIERIDIHGNVKTEDRVVRREFDFAEGDAYNRALIDRGERRLKNLGFFKTVKITKDRGSAPDKVIVNVALEEQPTGQYSISGGYSSVDGWIGEVSASERNLLGRGIFVKAAATLGQYTRGIDLAYSEPYFLGSRVSLGLELFDKQSISNANQSYDSLNYGAKVALGMALTDDLSGQLRYSIYNQSLTLNPANGVASLPI